MGLIYLDACLLIYLIERHARWGAKIAHAVARFGEQSFGISPLVKCECLVGPIKRGDPVLRRDYEALFDQFVSTRYSSKPPSCARASGCAPRMRCTSPAPSTIAATRYGRMTTV